MTAYEATTGSALSGTIGLSVTAATYEARIAQIVFSGGFTDTVGGTSSVFLANVYSGSTVSGGSAGPGFALRQGAPTGAATVRVSPTVSAFGTQLDANAGLGGGFSYTHQSPYDFIISPGTTVVAEMSSSGSGSGTFTELCITIYYEELRLSWPY
jgi:hypothetical protein